MRVHEALRSSRGEKARFFSAIKALTRPYKLTSSHFDEAYGEAARREAETGTTARVAFFGDSVVGEVYHAFRRMAPNASALWFWETDTQLAFDASAATRSEVSCSNSKL